MLYLLFFLLRDGNELARRIRHAIPLRPEQKRALFEKFAVVIRATVKGNIAVALVQRALGGAIFWFLGIHAPLLWAVLMAFLALVPAVGAGLVWLPVALFLLMTGATWQGIVLMAFGVLVISVVDNNLRPILVGQDTRLPDYVVLISTLGEISIFGINGFALGTRYCSNVRGCVGYLVRQRGNQKIKVPTRYVCGPERLETLQLLFVTLCMTV